VEQTLRKGMGGKTGGEPRGTEIGKIGSKTKIKEIGQKDPKVQYPAIEPSRARSHPVGDIDEWAVQVGGCEQ